VTQTAGFAGLRSPPGRAILGYHGGRRGHPQIGVTLVEILVGVALLGLLLVGLKFAIRLNRSAMTSMEKTDLTARLRNSSIIIGRALSLATEFLYPAQVSQNFAHQIIFRNHRNEIVAIFVTDQNVLSMYNYTTDQLLEITPSTLSFKSRLVKDNLMEYRIEIKRDQYHFVIQNQLSTCNTLP
jgi:Tfp pilus assembly protein FimT